MSEASEPSVASRAGRRMARIGRGGAFLAGAVAASLLTATVVSAGVQQSFSDVPPGHPFFGEVATVADACVAGGYADGTYKPANPVTRQAMAAFLARLGSRSYPGSKVGNDQIPFGSASSSTYSPYITVAEVEVTVPDLPGNCDVPVTLMGQVTVMTTYTRASACHATQNCNVYAELAVDGSAIPSTSLMGRITSDYAALPMSVSGMVPQPDGTTRLYSLRVRGYNVQADGATVGATRGINALTTPFEGSGPPLS